MPPKLPALRPARIIRALQASGFTIERQTGSHVVLDRAGRSRPLVIAMHNKELSPTTIRQILREAGVTEEEFLARV